MAVLPKVLDKNIVLAIVPIFIPFLLSLYLIGNPITIIIEWANANANTNININTNTNKYYYYPSISSQLLAYMVMSIVGYYLTSKLVPTIQQYTLRKGICGKDLGKRGTATADIPIPEALGIVPGAVFLVCLILCLVGYATINDDDDNNNTIDTTNNKLLDVNSALLSICFMLFLGFTDDVLDWPWRYKLILPTIASLPLLCCYNGSTTIVVPKQLRQLLVTTTSTATGAGTNNELSMLGIVLELTQVIKIDRLTAGTLIDLGLLYFVYMSMLAVFCTNAINIFAGINGLEAGQSYVIGCSILIHNFVEILLLLQKKSLSSVDTVTTDPFIDIMINNHLFSIMILGIFVCCCLGLLKYNWYPASVFVGDTFCYFAGMTFAVVGILGHFSKTLLLFFIPQIINFVWSVPQLFKFVPCPRHRLPTYNPVTKLLHPSTFDCTKDQYKYILKQNPNDTTGINMTILNIFLQIFGPMSERDLCISLLLFQILCCTFGFFCRYYLATFFFDD